MRFFVLCLMFACQTLNAQDEIPQKKGIRILGPHLSDNPPSVVQIPAGRFIPFETLSGQSVYIAPNPAYRIYKLQDGVPFPGIKYDAPASQEEPEFWTPPKGTKGPVYVLLTRKTNGKYDIQPIMNGVVSPDGKTDGPVEDGPPLKIEIVKGITPVPVPPGPEPPPNPDNEDKIKAKMWGYVLIEETKDALNNRGQIMREVHTFCQENKIKWREADKDVVDKDGNPPKDLVTYLDKSKKKGVPVLFIVGMNGEPLYEGARPDNAAEFIKLLKTHGGIK